MSLLITSNTPNNDVNEQTIGINRPYSYTNQLQGTLKIPKNSQIAVQSVKINKTGNVMLNKYNSQYAFYFGRNPENPKWDLTFSNATTYFRNASATDTQNNSLSIPTYVLPPIGRNKNISLNTDDLSSAIQRSMKKVLCHPNLLENACGTRNAGPRVIAMRNASAAGFTGFEWTIDNSASTFNEDLTGSALYWGNESDPASPPSYITGTLTNLTALPADVFEKTYPMSLAHGELYVNIGNHATGVNVNSEFRIGLCRSQHQTIDPPYYQNNMPFFYDWVVCSELNILGTYDIVVYQAVGDGVQNGRGWWMPQEGGGIFMKEFQYYNNYNATGGVRATWDELNGGDGPAVKVKFTIQNEQVKIGTYDEYDVLIRQICTGALTNNIQVQNMKPICPTTRFLFPKIQLAASKNMVIEKFNGVDVKDFVYGQCDHQDWWNQRNCDGDVTECQTLDENLFYQIIPGPFLRLNLKAFNNQLGLISNRCACSARLITAPSMVHSRTDFLNAQYIFGFIGNSVPRPVSGDLGALAEMIFQSANTPLLNSKESIFIRLKNFPIQSANFAKSMMSNILYHVPTFSNSGAEVGSLHFEANEMVYLDLQNKEDIFPSSIEVDFVYSNETLAVGLEGKSCVVFHIRPVK